MKNLTQYKHWYLITVSLLVTTLESIPRIAMHLSGETFKPKLYGTEYHPSFTLFVLIADTLLSSIAFSYFNYSVRENTLFPGLPKWLKRVSIVLFSLAIIAVFTSFKSNLYEIIFDAPLTKRLQLIFLIKTVFIFLISLISTYILYLIIKSRIIEIENLKLKRENIEAQFTSLKDQLNPHFLFNTLNSLSSVIRLGEKSESLTFVDKMSEVYRYILESNEYKTIEVDKELYFLDAYLFMLQKRFGNKLNVKINLSDETKRRHIPPMALQILVENAVKHNKISTDKPLTIWVVDNDMHIVVSNILQKKNSEVGYGIGLANLRNRYRLLMDEDIEIHETDTMFMVKIPVIV